MQLTAVRGEPPTEQPHPAKPSVGGQLHRSPDHEQPPGAAGFVRHEPLHDEDQSVGPGAAPYPQARVAGATGYHHGQATTPVQPSEHVDLTLVRGRGTTELAHGEPPCAQRRRRLRHPATVSHSPPGGAQANPGSGRTPCVII